VPPIASGYATDRVYRLHREELDTGVQWVLREQGVLLPVRKQYDSGDVNEWLQSYEDAGPTIELRFLGAGSGDGVDGLLTWRSVAWNRTIWLVDIRVRRRLRGRGLGSALVGTLKRIADSSGVRGISVETQITNFPAIQFYRAQGFEVTGFNDHLYANDDLTRQDVALYLFLELSGAQ
jgi:ribosomal protein S18 acetylase RimI-like enzyme